MLLGCSSVPMRLMRVLWRLLGGSWIPHAALRLRCAWSGVGVGSMGVGTLQRGKSRGKANLRNRYRAKQFRQRIYFFKRYQAQAVSQQLHFQVSLALLTAGAGMNIRNSSLESDPIASCESTPTTALRMATVHLHVTQGYHCSQQLSSPAPFSYQESMVEWRSQQFIFLLLSHCIILEILLCKGYVCHPFVWPRSKGWER